MSIPEQAVVAAPCRKSGMRACQNCGHPASHHEDGVCWTKGDGKECVDYADLACFCPEYTMEDRA